MKQLTVLFNGSKQYAVLLDVPEVFIGRGRKVHLPLDDNPIVSRRHASVRAEMDYHVLRDLGGANGTFVNESRVKEVRLRPGDRIILGKHTLRYEDAEATARSLKTLQLGNPAGDEQDTMSAEAVGFEEVGGGPEPWGAGPVGHGPGAGADFSGAVHTMAASKDELETLLAQQKIKKGPHLSINWGRNIELIGLDDEVYLVGHTDDCRVRLKGRRWFGRIAASLEKRKGIWWIHARSPFWNPVRIGGSKLQKKRKLRTPTVIRIGELKIRFSPGEG